jgi:hypothetical protein
MWHAPKGPIRAVKGSCTSVKVTSITEKVTLIVEQGRSGSSLGAIAMRELVESVSPS